MTHAFEIFVDMGCGMCSHEARMMARLDRGRGRLKVTDLSTLLESGARDGVTYERAMRSIHGRTSEGEWVEGVEVFRRAYGALGWGWLWAPTAWPVLRPIVDACYRFFARWRFERRLKQGCAMPNQPAG